MCKVIFKGMINFYFIVLSFIFNYDIDMIEMMVFCKKLIDLIMVKIGLKVSFIDLIGMVVVKILMKLEYWYLNVLLINDV